MTKPKMKSSSARRSARTARASKRACAALRRAEASVIETLESRLFLSTSPAEAALDTTFNQPAGQLGINLNNPGPLDSSALWTDASKNFSNWQYAGTTNALSGSDVTQYGFPSGTAASTNATAYSYMLGYPVGNYDLQFQGTGTIGFSGIGSIVPGSFSYNATTDTTTEVISVQQQSSVPLVMTASGLQSSDPLHNLQLMMPGFIPGTTQLVNPAVASRLGIFGTIRLMDAFSTNSDTISNWSQLTNPNSFSFSGPSGISYEDAIALGNATHSNLWWNIPAYATNSFVTSLAELLKYGADANGNPYTSTQTSPVYAPLNAGLKIHIEYGNELENFTQPVAVANNVLANNNVQAGILDGSLQIDGEEELLKLHQIYSLFQSVYSPGGASFSSQVGFVFGGAFSSTGPDAFTNGAFVFAGENTGLAGQNNPANWGPLSGWLEAVATSNYHGLNSGDSPTTLDQLFQNLNADLTASSNTAAATFVSQASINVPLYGYEGGQALVGSNATTNALYLAAQSDPRMGAFYQKLIDEWYSSGGSLFNLYSFAAAYSNGSAWGLLQSAAATGSTKWDAVLQRLVPMGDATLDGNVDYSDFQILQANWASTSAAWQTGDFNGDGTVDKKDLSLLQQNLNTANFTAAQLTAYNSFLNSVTNSVTPSTPGTPTVSVAATTSTLSINWSPSYDAAGIADYLVFRNAIQVGTSTTNSFSDSGLAAGNTYVYTVEAVDTAAKTSALSGALSVTTALPLINLTGTILGTAGSYNNNGNTANRAFDGNIYTYFDAPGINGNWVGRDLTSAKTITAITYAPRPFGDNYAYETRMVGGQFQYASDANFTNPVTFYTIFATPSDGYTTVTLSVPVTAEYVRYLAPNGSYGNVAEIGFEASGAPTAPQSPGTPTLTSSTSTTATIAWTAPAGAGVSQYIVFRNNAQIGTTDGSTYTYSDIGLSTSTTYSYTVEAVAGGITSVASAALSVTTPSSTVQPPGTPTLTSSTSTTATIAWAASNTAGVTQYIVLRNNVQIGTTNGTTLTYPDSGLSASTTYSYTVEAVAGGLTSAASGTLSVSTPAATSPIQLTGSIIGTTGSYDGVSTSAKAFDGNLGTFFDASNPSGNWIGLDLGSAYTITSLQFAPRVASGGYPYEQRMVGGVFQVSNNATFSTSNGGVVATLATITSTPADGYTTVTIPASSSPGAFEFVRYVAPANSYGNIAEMVVFGTPASGTQGVSPPGTPTLTSLTSTTATIAWAASNTAGVTQYIVLRNNVQIGTTNGTTLTYPDSGLSASTTYSYTVEAVAGGLTSAASGALSVSTPSGVASSKVPGAIVGTAGSYDGVSTIAKVFDGNTSTFFDAPSANGNWAGLDPGAAYNVTSIRYAPRPASGGFAYEGRMVGGIFQASSTADFSNGVVNLYTINSQPVDGYTTVTLTTPVTGRYFRYLAPNGSYGNIAELEFDGTAAAPDTQAPTPPGTPKILTAPTSSTVSITWLASTDNVGVDHYIILRNGVQAGTSQTNTFSDSGLPVNATFNYTVEAVDAAGNTSPASAPLAVTTLAGPDTQAPTMPGTPMISTPATSNSVSITWGPSTDNVGVDHYIILRNGVQVGTSTTNTFSDSGLSATTTYNYTVEAADAAGNTSAASAAVPVTTLGTTISGKLSGAIIGTAGSYDGVSTSAKAFDGNAATFFDAPTANGNWVGLDLGVGSAFTITSIRYAPRAISGGFAYEGRMVGGIFQASNTADFSSGVVTLYTITSQPADGITTQAVSAPGTYRYVRYLAPSGSYGNIAELEFDGF